MLAVRLRNPKIVKQVKQVLESRRLLDKSIKISRDDSGAFVIPTVCSNEAILDGIIRADLEVGSHSDNYSGGQQSEYEIIVDESSDELSIISGTDTESSIGQADPITIAVHQIANAISLFHDDPLRQKKLSDISVKFSRRKYSIYPPLVLFTAGTNLSQYGLPDAFYEQVIKQQTLFFQRKQLITHIAENAPIAESDRVRRPADLICLYGDFGPPPSTVPESPSSEDLDAAFWCSAIQNGIYQTWAPRYTMFSRGNITEKSRVLDTFAKQAPIEGTTIVDMYAGIGYFTFSYARNHPARILCWEINPFSVEGLIRGALANNFPVRLVRHNEPYEPLGSDFIVVFLEDNCHALERISQAHISDISHVNLGLLPDSRLAWSDSVRIGRRHSTQLAHPTVLHIHENIAATITSTWPTMVESTLSNRVQFVSLEVIKTFAPGVYHVCGDFRVRR
ncbi:Trm12p [Sugiyamaella lignohabitans]|uniref:tRNA(Phe) (4-demethylwyosine(37)-C(7)) aminocarboxypropyltransferase n=1 Tax=Sugiyamaella lignohabitans TaxID=796027 RepID=A0A161HH75_9ASCO|nr:Trm12p [Sugiyamaella lignohabitans]ANB11407.1 Trm12p [Sugiyamaella lignohabitans]